MYRRPGEQSYQRRASTELHFRYRPRPVTRRKDIPEIAEHDSSGSLMVKDVNLHVPENCKNHHTDQFYLAENRSLVIRRGQPFMITITFNEEFDESKHDLKFKFLIGEDPLPSKKSDVCFGLTDRWYPEEWGAKLMSKKGNTVILYIHTGCDCIIGEYDFLLETNYTGKKKNHVYAHQGPIFILFNPWCKNDQVFMEDKVLLKEYILNDSGYIYQGSGTSQILAKPWNYGQFEEGILDICMLILRQGFSEISHQMSDPVRVTRAISQMINSPENNGVVMMDFAEEPNRGRSPSAWSGSVNILHLFRESGESVRYGQDYVFAGVMTTVCRALGLPCRPVTNFVSAHDSDENVTNDIYVEEDEDGNIIERKEDTTWNYHVWNEVWMSRPDLPVGYGGWQALDPTPQEASDGVYCCGPSPVIAIRNGEVNQCHDTRFMFAELNADRVYWLRHPMCGNWEVLYTENDSLGQYVCTKDPECKPDSDPKETRMDITADYKIQCGSEYERINLVNTSRRNLRMLQANNQARQFEDMEFHMEARENVMIGHKFNVTLLARNLSLEHRSLKTSFYCKIVNHYGDTVGMCRELHVGTEHKAKEGKPISMQIIPEDYMRFIDRIDSHMAMKISVYTRVMQTDQVFMYTESFQMDWPTLHIDVPRRIRVGQNVLAKVTFINPLSVPLSMCMLSLEGSGLNCSKHREVMDVPPNSNLVEDISFTPLRSGDRRIVINFHCKELQDITGSALITVTK